MSAVAAEKTKLRAELRVRLAAQDPAERAERSARIVESAGSLPAVRTAAHLLLHRSLPTEVAIDGLLGEAVLRGQAAYVPLVDGEMLHYVRVAADTAWRRSTLGVLEPEKGERLLLDELAGASTTIVVPGLGFDGHGRRLGRGGGHYDRFLAAARAAGSVHVVAVAFDLQIVPRVPANELDQRADRIVTETRVIVAAR